MLPILYYNIDVTLYYGSDADDASEYVQDITDDCGAYNLDDDCWNQGNRFSKIYVFGGTTMMLLAFNSVLMLLGAWFMHARLIAGCCGCLCCCLNLACIITTAVFRFNSWGKLSTLCDGPAKYDDSDTLSDDRTVSGDASIIVGLWVAMMIFCCTNCCHWCAAGK